MDDTVIVNGYEEFIRDARLAGATVSGEVRRSFKEAGEVVRADWARRLTTDTKKGKGKYRVKSAAGLKVRVHTREVIVEQTLGKTTGLHGQYGAFQAIEGRAALAADKEIVAARAERAVEKVASIFNV